MLQQMLQKKKHAAADRAEEASAVTEDEGAKEGEPPAKYARTLSQDGMEDAKADSLADPFEKEKDAPEDGRALLSHEVCIDGRDGTLNVIPTMGGRVLMSLSDCGMQYLVAAARANVGVQAGRYLFEVKVLEVLSPAEQGRRSMAAPRQHVRVGLSLAGSSTFLGETEDSICFDSEGMFIGKRCRIQVAERFARGQVLGVLLNLDADSPNANTFSLFRDGVRASEPQQIPENLRGKPLFPHVSFRNVSLHMHFGPEALAPPPFRCRTLQAAALDDVVVAPSPGLREGQCEVVFPVGVPDEGLFDWLDHFLEKRPDFVELSDRKIVEWAEKSGLTNYKTNPLKTSNDRPDVSFGIPALDDLSARKVLRTVACLVPRNYVVMELKSNLIKSERGELLHCFKAPQYRRTAMVVMGEPSQDHKSRVQAALLAAKQEKLEVEWKAGVLERQRKRHIAKRQKQLMEQRKAILATKEKEEEAKAALLSAKKEEEKVESSAAAAKVETSAAEAASEEDRDGDAGEQKGQKPTEEAAAAAASAEVKVQEAAAGEAESKEEEEAEEPEPPEARLTEEEARTWFKPQSVSDLTTAVLAASFARFSVPELEEGFSDIHFEWQEEAASRAYLRKWVLAKKLTTRVEDLQPTEWFTTQQYEWQRVLQDWQLKQKEFKPEAMAKQQKARREQEQAAAALAVEEQEQPEGRSGGAQEGLDKEEGSADKKLDAAALDDATTRGGQEGVVDIFAVKDVCDIGGGEPLFANFMFEDWTLMTLRFELYLLLRAFKQDVNDPDRPGIPEAHLTYYYARYFRKQLNTRFFGMATVADLINLVKDTVRIGETDSLVTAQVPEDMEPVSELFVKLTEEARRERKRRIDAGDETAKLKFSVLSLPAQGQVQGQEASAGKGQARVVLSSSAPRASATWSQPAARGSWQRPSGQQQQFYNTPKPQISRWPGQVYAPKQQGWR